MTDTIAILGFYSFSVEMKFFAPKVVQGRVCYQLTVT